VVVCGDGEAIVQLLHVDDAAPAFVYAPGRAKCVGETYNMVNRGYTTWAGYHRAAMHVIGTEVEIVGVPFADLQQADVPGFDWCANFSRYHQYFGGAKLMIDVPEFRPQISLEAGIAQVLEAIDREGRAVDASTQVWEDRIVAAQRLVRQALSS
jgi:nucleoside-diphosphate-sugar epimerase